MSLTHVLQTAGLLQLWASGFIERVEASPLPLRLLARQLLAYTIQEGGLGRNLWQSVLGKLPPYVEAISRGTADLILNHPVLSGMLVDAGGLLSIGPEDECDYGFRQFMALTSVFYEPTGLYPPMAMMSALPTTTYQPGLQVNTITWLHTQYRRDPRHDLGSL